jgi:hypothetical protein
VVPISERCFASGPSVGTRLRSEGHAVGDGVQPARHGAAADRAALSGERQERRLEGVFRFLFVAEDTAAQAEDHRAVPPKQQFEGGLIAVGDKALEELRVGRPGVAVQTGDAAEMADDGLQRNAGHTLACGVRNGHSF